MSCVGVSEADLQPIPSCEEAPAASLAAALCAPTLCTFKGESCRQIYTSCATHEGCSRAIACSLLCKAGEDSVTNCAKFAGSGITSALKVRSCQQELQNQEANNPPSMCAK